MSRSQRTNPGEHNVAKGVSEFARLLARQAAREWVQPVVAGSTPPTANTKGRSLRQPAVQEPPAQSLRSPEGDPNPKEDQTND